MKRFIKYRHLAAAFLATLVVIEIGLSAQAQTPNEGLPIPDSPKENLTAIDRLFRPPSPTPLALFPHAIVKLELMLG